MAGQLVDRIREAGLTRVKAAGWKLPREMFAAPVDTGGWAC